MDKSPILNIVFSFALLLIGLMFIEGIWKKKGKVIKSGFNVDNLFFPNLKDKRILKSGDQLAFLVCLIMSLLTLINGLLSLIFDKIPNVSAIFIFVAVFLSWPIRILFIYSKRNSNYNDMPRIWPFPK
jgi:hypothetical protein